MDGRRSIFFVLTALGVINFLITWRLLPETGPIRSGHQDARKTSELWSNFRQLITSRAFLGYAIGGGCATTSMYAFISAAPFIFTEQLHQPNRDVGIYLAVIVGALWFGSVVASRVAGRVAVNRQMIGGNLLSVAGAFIFLGAVLLGILNIPITVGSMVDMITLRRKLADGARGDEQAGQQEREARQAAQEGADAARALAHVRDAVLLLDRDGALRYANPASRTLLADADVDALLEELREGNVTAAGPRPVSIGGRERWLTFAETPFDAGQVH